MGTKKLFSIIGATLFLSTIGATVHISGVEVVDSSYSLKEAQKDIVQRMNVLEQTAKHAVTLANENEEDASLKGASLKGEFARISNDAKSAAIKAKVAHALVIQLGEKLRLISRVKMGELKVMFASNIENEFEAAVKAVNEASTEVAEVSIEMSKLSN